MHPTIIAAVTWNLLQVASCSLAWKCCNSLRRQAVTVSITLPNFRKRFRSCSNSASTADISFSEHSIFITHVPSFGNVITHVLRRSSRFPLLCTAACLALALRHAFVGSLLRPVPSLHAVLLRRWRFAFGGPNPASPSCSPLTTIDTFSRGPWLEERVL